MNKSSEKLWSVNIPEEEDAAERAYEETEYFLSKNKPIIQFNSVPNKQEGQL